MLLSASAFNVVFCALYTRGEMNEDPIPPIHTALIWSFYDSEMLKENVTTDGVTPLYQHVRNERKDEANAATAR